MQLNLRTSMATCGHTSSRDVLPSKHQQQQQQQGQTNQPTNQTNQTNKPNHPINQPNQHLYRYVSLSFADAWHPVHSLYALQKIQGTLSGRLLQPGKNFQIGHTTVLFDTVLVCGQFESLCSCKSYKYPLREIHSKTLWKMVAGPDYLQVQNVRRVMYICIYTYIYMYLHKGHKFTFRPLDNY